MQLALVAVLAPAIALTASLADGTSVPDPVSSSVDPCPIVCPQGDFTFKVLVRDHLNNPVPNSTVVIAVCDCPQVRLCPPEPMDPYVTHGCGGSGIHGVSATTNARGEVNFPLRAGGTCAGAGIRVDGVDFGFRPVASPDQNGDLLVDGTDVAIANAKLGTSDRTADFDCDQTVTNADLGIQQQHAGHTCDNVVPVRPGSWGGLKTIYR